MYVRETTTTMTLDHPPVDMNVLNLTVHLGDNTLPDFSDFPAWATWLKVLSPEN